MRTGSVCFDQVFVRVRRNASNILEVATITTTSRPLLSLTTNMSLELTPDQSDVFTGHNASEHWPATELRPNSTLLPATVTDNVTEILDIFEASTFASISGQYSVFLLYICMLETCFFSCFSTVYCRLEI